MLTYIKSLVRDPELDNEPSIIFLDGKQEVKRLLAFSINYGWYFTYKGKKYQVEDGKIREVALC